MSGLNLEAKVGSEVADLLYQFQRNFLDQLDSRIQHLKAEYAKSYIDVDEYAISQSATTINLNSQSTNFERITNLVAYCGPNAGRVTIGDRQIIIPAATCFTLAGVWRISATDVRRIESVTLTAGSVSGVGAAGLLFLELFGTEIPIGSIMW